MKWIPVSEELPLDTMRVLFIWSEEIDDLKTSLGFYASRREMECDDSWEDEQLEYCEQDENGRRWLIEGWYEGSYIFETLRRRCNVTHWMRITRPPC